MNNKIRRVWLRIYPLFKKSKADNIFAIAGQSAFFLILSSVPLLMFAVSVIRGLHIPVKIVNDAAKTIFNDAATQQIVRYFSEAYDNNVSVSLITIIVTLWSASKGVHAITNGLNRVHNTYENRHWIVLRLRAMSYTVLMFVIILLTIFVVGLGSSVNDWIKPYLADIPVVLSVIYYLRYIIVFLWLAGLFTLVYRNMPNLDKMSRKKYSLRSQLPGAVFCALAWMALSFGIAFYVDHFNGFSIYGGLTSLAIVMVWLYFCMVCLMYGAEFNCIYHDDIVRLMPKFARKKKNKD